MRSLVDRCWTQLADVAGRYEGWIDSTSGDQIMVVFGAPVAHEDDPERAVRCALEMIRCAEDDAEEFGGLPLRIGVNTGEVMFAPVGPANARQQTILGDAVNIGARLQAAAPRSGVLVGENTWRATRHAIAYDEPEEIHAKGKDEPVKAWRATRVIAAPAERPVSGAPMIGRNEVLGQLHALWRRVTSEQRAHLVTVLGQPGIGKTRLANELALVVADEGGRVVRGRSLPYGEMLGYGAFAQQVKALAGIRDSDPPEQARAGLTEFLRQTGTVDASDVGENLATLIGLSDHSAADRQQLFYSARRFVESLAIARPTLLVFEDIHWADKSLLELISSLAARVREAPLMLLTLARPELLENTPSWGGGLGSYTALPLSPLSEEDAVALVEQLAPGIADPRHVAEAAAGNPLFIEELAASVSEGTTAGELPTTVKALIASRLDALPAEERRLILDASVVGKVFWRGALERMSGHSALAGLDALEARDMIRREPVSRLETDTEFMFKHMLIREVAYATLPRATRRERHAEVARFLEEAAGERSVELAAVVGYHWREAGEAERALEYLLPTAEAASRAWAKSEAVRLYEEALSLLPEGDPRHLELRLRRAGTLVEAGDLVPAVTELDDLMPRLSGRERVEALLLRGRCAYWMVDMATGLRTGEEAEALAASLDDPELSAAVAAIAVEGTSMQGKLEEGRSRALRALADWPDGARPTARALMLGMLGTQNYWLGRVEEAYEASVRAYEEGLELQHVEATLVAGAQIGMALTEMGRHEEALTVFERMAAHGRELELVPRLTSRTVNAWGGTLRELREFERARELNAQGVEMAARANFLNGQVQGKIDLLNVDLATGETAEAERALPALFEEAENLRGWHEWLVGGRLTVARAELLLAVGKNEDAVDAAIEAHERSARVGRLKYMVRALIAHGRALIELGRAGEAAAVLHEAMSGAQRMRHPHTIWSAAEALARALYAGGDDAGAEAADAAARAALEGFVSRLSPERRQRFLEGSAARV